MTWHPSYFIHRDTHVVLRPSRCTRCARHGAPVLLLSSRTSPDEKLALWRQSRCVRHAHPPCFPRHVAPGLSRPFCCGRNVAFTMQHSSRCFRNLVHVLLHLPCCSRHAEPVMLPLSRRARRTAARVVLQLPRCARNLAPVMLRLYCCFPRAPCPMINSSRITCFVASDMCSYHVSPDMCHSSCCGRYVASVM